jgi:hypothetical protein
MSRPITCPHRTVLPYCNRLRSDLWGISVGIASRGSSRCKRPTTTMTARPSPAQFSSPTPPRDLETWCGGVAFLEPKFDEQAVYVEIMKDEDPNPEDFEPMIVSFCPSSTILLTTFRSGHLPAPQEHDRDGLGHDRPLAERTLKQVPHACAQDRHVPALDRDPRGQVGQGMVCEGRACERSGCGSLQVHHRQDRPRDGRTPGLYQKGQGKSTLLHFASGCLPTPYRSRTMR